MSHSKSGGEHRGATGPWAWGTRLRRSPARWAPALALVVGVLLLAGCSADPAGLDRGGPPSPTPGPGDGGPSPGPGSIRPGARAPEFQLGDLAGQPVTLASLRGHVVWINFWATWCPACKTEMPRMEQKYQQYRDQGLVILGLDVQESPETIRTWTHGRFTWRLLRDSAGTVTDLYRVEGLPTHVFVDRLGVIRTVTSGELDAGQMDAAITPLLALAPSP